MTTGISLVRENTESMQPPRALWVSFPLGRPLGKPGDAQFQLDVIAASLALLEREYGPVLEDYPHDVPPLEAESVAACPVSFAREAADDDSWQVRLSRELSELRPWYQLAVRRRDGRTLFGVSNLTPEAIVDGIAERLEQQSLPADVVWLKRAVEDMKAYYLEAMTAQPGEIDARGVQSLFWKQTEMGAAVLEFYKRFQRAENKQLKLVARILAPREAVGAATGPEPDGDTS